MITAQLGGGRFYYRVAGVLLDSDRVLLHRAIGDPNWVLPGGRCEFMEESTDCLRREMREVCDLAPHPNPPPQGGREMAPAPAR